MTIRHGRIVVSAMLWRGAPRGKLVVSISLLVVSLVGGCRQWFIDDADREVATLIERRQLDALNLAADAHVGTESGEIGLADEMYAFTPSSLESDVPEAYRQATAVLGDEETGDSGDSGNDVNGIPEMPSESEAKSPQAEPQLYTLSDTLAYAMHHARDFQTEKELLYLSALDLTLERHLWTPRFVQSVLGIEYANYGQVRDFDRAMSAVSEFAVEQRLPFGGEITARVVNTLMRDLGVNVTSGESGRFAIDARLPLLRGAGPTAYESRYQTERNLIYAVRRFERFRRQFMVDIAGDFFALLSDKAQIESSESQAASLRQDYEKAQALADAERTLRIESDRARVSMLDAQNRVLVAQERFDTNIDTFKIRIGMPTKMLIDVVDEEMDLRAPDVSIDGAAELALQFRLDLLNVRDQVDDSRRLVRVANNDLLPNLDFTGSVTMDTDPNQVNSTSYNTERTTWRAALTMEVPLDRKEERNNYRRALIALRRSTRDYEEQVDRVRLEVRRAARRVEQAQFSMEIQLERIRINEFRVDQARAQLDAGKLSSNRDVVEALDDLREAKNGYADSLSEYRRAILEFLRDTGMLRVGNDGMWIRYGDETNGADDTGEDVSPTGNPGP